MISLIVCTRNRAERLNGCLEAISRIRTRESWELILVDNGSTDHTREVLTRFAATLAVPVTVCADDRPGVSWARNTGWGKACGQVIAFIDDDCYAQADLLDATASVFEDPELGFVAGRILLHDPDDYPITIFESTEAQEFSPGQFLRAGQVQGANMIVRRVVLEQIGGFDPAFGAGAPFVAEDIDLAARASLAGWKGRFEPACVVRHHHRRKAVDVGPLMKTYDIGRGGYHMKLLLESRKVRWYLHSLRALLRRLPTKPASAWHEFRGGLAYLRYWFTDPRSRRPFFPAESKA